MIFTKEMIRQTGYETWYDFAEEVTEVSSAKNGICQFKYYPKSKEGFNEAVEIQLPLTHEEVLSLAKTEIDLIFKEASTEHEKVNTLKRTLNRKYIELRYPYADKSGNVVFKIINIPEKLFIQFYKQVGEKPSNK